MPETLGDQEVFFEQILGKAYLIDDLKATCDKNDRTKSESGICILSWALDNSAPGLSLSLRRALSVS